MLLMAYDATPPARVTLKSNLAETETWGVSRALTCCPTTWYMQPTCTNPWSPGDAVEMVQLTVNGPAAT
ncbi:hypothetical protein NPX13_g7949 [Xylaria arbuscula]|uniref:Uncharacterized protein n=1 Tax=Xylaria arbuscula TaxID=114810 RepID=A0A9W8N9W9_9PEZI|nr:hypothetical protein NPX13_g7949 [Xylaria arbuscula]